MVKPQSTKAVIEAVLTELEDIFIEASEAELHQDAKDASSDIAQEAYRIRRLLIAQDKGRLCPSRESLVPDVCPSCDEPSSRTERVQ